MIFDVAVIGSGAAGIMSSIKASSDKKSVLLLEKMPKIGLKLKATGGGRCNITNKLELEDFMNSFGRQGRFMRDALGKFYHDDLIKFLADIGLQTHAPDGFRVFPLSHDSKSVLDVLIAKMKDLRVNIKCNQDVQNIEKTDKTFEIFTKTDKFISKQVIIATGGLGYSILGASGDGYRFAKSMGHHVTDLHAAMIPLHVEEKWVQNCRADTIAKATLKINLPKMQKIRKTGDLIFTKNGIRGPVVLDFAREVTPFLKKHKKVPLLANLTKGMDENQIQIFLKQETKKSPQKEIIEILQTILPQSLSKEMCNLADIDCTSKYTKIPGFKKEKLIKLLAWTPLNVTGHDGFEKAMITRGGVNLKEINPKNMQSKLTKGLYFCGEVVDLDGPCGGYNLQWSFSSGYLAGCLLDL